MKTPTYVIGHRNPDADAICSALGYAALKNKLGYPDVIAARCGNSNPRIDSILKQFSVALPVFVGDVTPRVQDFMVRNPHTITSRQTCAEAMEVIDQHDVRILPVIDEENCNKLLGEVSVFQLGEYFIPKPQDTRAMRHVRTSISSIARSLKGEVINLTNEERIEDLYVRIGAMDIRSFNTFATKEDTPTEQSIIVVGDRYDIQSKCIQLGVRLLVITGGLDVDEEIVSLAKERGVSLVISPFDSASTSWIIRSAHRIDKLIEKNFQYFAPEEKLAAVKRKVANSPQHIFMVVDEDERLIGVFSKTDLLKPPTANLILVDHNEVTQAVPGASDVDILEILDHHRLGNPPTQQPILFVNEPVGSTSTIIADQYRRHGLEPDAPIAGVLMGGMIADTLNLQSPTSTPKDAEILEWLSKIAGITANDLAEIIFASGSVIISHTPEEVIRADMKTYEEGDLRFSVSQVEELGYNNFWNNEEAIMKALESVRKKEGLYFSALLVTDINTQNSLLLMAGAEDIISEVRYPSVHHNTFDMPGVVSRKKQLMPFLTSLIKGSASV